MTTALTYILLFVEVVVSFLLIGIILMQRTKGQGIGVAFGAGMGESLFGSQMGNVLTKTTVILAIVFLVNTTLLAMLSAGRGEGSVTDAIAAPQPQSPPAAQAPQGMPMAPPGEGMPMAQPVPPEEMPGGAPVSQEPMEAPPPPESSNETP